MAVPKPPRGLYQDQGFPGMGQVPTMDDELLLNVKSSKELADLASSYVSRQVMLHTDLNLTACELDRLFKLIHHVSEENSNCLFKFVMDYHEKMRSSGADLAQRNHGPVIWLLSELLKVSIEPISNVLLCLHILQAFVTNVENVKYVVDYHVNGVVLGSIAAHANVRDVQLFGCAILAELARYLPDPERNSKAMVREAAVDIIRQTVDNFPEDLEIIRWAAIAFATVACTLNTVARDVSKYDNNTVELHSVALLYVQEHCTPVVLDLQTKHSDCDIIQKECRRFLDVFTEHHDTNGCDDKSADRIDKTQNDVVTVHDTVSKDLTSSSLINSPEDKSPVFAHSNSTHLSTDSDKNADESVTENIDATTSVDNNSSVPLSEDNPSKSAENNIPASSLDNQVYGSNSTVASNSSYQHEISGNVLLPNQSITHLNDSSTSLDATKSVLECLDEGTSDNTSVSNLTNSVCVVQDLAVTSEDTDNSSEKASSVPNGVSDLTEMEPVESILKKDDDISAGAENAVSIETNCEEDESANNLIAESLDKEKITEKISDENSNTTDGKPDDRSYIESVLEAQCKRLEGSGISVSVTPSPVSTAVNEDIDHANNAESVVAATDEVEENSSPVDHSQGNYAAQIRNLEDSLRAALPDQTNSQGSSSCCSVDLDCERLQVRRSTYCLSKPKSDNVPTINSSSTPSISEIQSPCSDGSGRDFPPRGVIGAKHTAERVHESHDLEILSDMDNDSLDVSLSNDVMETPDDVSDIPSFNECHSVDEDSYSLSDCCSEDHHSPQSGMPCRSVSCPGLESYYRSFDNECPPEENLSEEDDVDMDLVDGLFPRSDRRAWGSIHPPNVEEILAHRTPSMISDTAGDISKVRLLHLPPSHSDPNLSVLPERKCWEAMPLQELLYLEEKSLESRSVSEVSSGASQTSEPDEEGVLDYLLTQPHGYMIKLLICRTQIMLYVLSYWNKKRYLTVFDILGRPVVRVLEDVRLTAEIADFARSRQSETVHTTFIDILSHLSKSSQCMTRKMIQKLLLAAEKLLVSPIPPSLSVKVCESAELVFTRWNQPDKKSIQSMLATVSKLQAKDEIDDEIRVKLNHLVATVEQLQCCEK